MNRFEKLKENLESPSDRAINKVVPFMTDSVMEFIAKSPFVVVSSSNIDGDCDSSPKGGNPGFVKIIDSTHLLIPDINGNRLFQGYTNFQSNPKVGLLFMVPGLNGTARVNGRVEQLSGNEVEAEGVGIQVSNSDRNTILVQGIIVEVDEAYLHCPRALKFSDLWNTDIIELNRS